MKSYLTLLLLVLSLGLFAQGTLKSGYIDVEYVISMMPETETANKALEGYYNQLLEELEKEYAELEKMENQFDSLAALADPPRIKLQLLGEKIQMGYTSLQDLQIAAEEEITEKELELFEPIYNKVDSALKSVATTEGYDVVYRIESLAFANEETMFDLSDMVIEALTKEE
jgi:outer membrane protein